MPLLLFDIYGSHIFYYFIQLSQIISNIIIPSTHKTVEAVI